jgi:hypothetical protein
MAGDEELPWTTSRCNRLLRPLSSKLSKLTKELEVPRNLNRETNSISSAFATKGSPHKTTNFTRQAYRPRGFEKATDPDWRPGVKSGATKKTYSGRGAKRSSGIQRSIPDGAAVARPGEIAFTPLVARMGGQLLDSPAYQASPLKKFSKKRGPLLTSMDRSQGLAANMPVDIQKLIQGLLEAYANILQATGSNTKRKGAGSLMGACLRKLPAYIELEEYFAQLDKLDEEEDHDEDRDIARDVYEHLEAQFEQQSGHGWRPFKQVVRAHGTSLLCSAIADGVLGLESLSYLVNHCLHVSAWDEAEQLVSAYVGLLEPLSMPINTRADLFDEKRQPYLSVAKHFVDRTGRHRFLYSLLDHMVALELLPLEWLATACMRPVWDRLVRTISENDHRTIEPCTRFLETCSLAGMGLPDERLSEDEADRPVSRRIVPSVNDDLRRALNTTYSSLVTVLCSIALVNNNREDGAGKVVGQRVMWALDAITIALTTREGIDKALRLLRPDPEDLQMFTQRALWAVSASFLVHLENCSKDETMTSLNSATLIRSLNRIAGQYSSNGANISTTLATIPALISSTARGTGRIWNDDGFDQLQRTVQALLSVSGHRLPHKLWTLKRLALESTIEFAKGTSDAQHVRFSHEIENKLRTSGRLVIAPSPQKDDSPATTGGFRWEEGIGEWVACTPFVKQQKKRLPRRPVRALDLLPTPTHSEEEEAEEDNEPAAPTAPDSDEDDDADSDEDDDDDDAIPPSSPIKPAPRTSTLPPTSAPASTTTLGKRSRAASPMVLIVKRAHMTPPDTPVSDADVSSAAPTTSTTCTTNAPLEPRRLRKRSDKKLAERTRTRTRRSRDASGGGLRSVERAVYYVDVDVDVDVDGGEWDESEDELSFA